MTEHRPTLVQWGNRHTTPAEVCMECSNPETGEWVPVSFCDKAKAAMDDDSSSLYADSYGFLDPEETD